MAITIEKIDPSDNNYSRNIQQDQYVNLTISEVNTYPIFAKSMAKAQSLAISRFGNNSVTTQITSSEENCINSVIFSNVTTQKTDIFHYNNNFYFIAYVKS